MKLANKALLSLALLSAWGTAAAIPITDFIDANPDRTIATTSPYTFTHDITDGLDGYVVGVDTITSALLSIHLIDDLSKGRETFSFLIGSEGASQVFDGSNLNNGAAGAFYDIVLATALSDLAADGRLDVTLSAQTGSYEFADSTLTAEITRGESVSSITLPAIAELPEPASLSLLGIGLFGLLGLGAARRRSR